MNLPSQRKRCHPRRHPAEKREEWVRVVALRKINIYALRQADVLSLSLYGIGMSESARTLGRALRRGRNHSRVEGEGEKNA